MTRQAGNDIVTCFTCKKNLDEDNTKMCLECQDHYCKSCIKKEIIGPKKKDYLLNPKINSRKELSLGRISSSLLFYCKYCSDISKGIIYYIRLHIYSKKKKKKKKKKNKKNKKTYFLIFK
jgi:hypothetical protein